MSFYLLDRPTAGRNFYTTRRQPVLAVVVHVTAGLQGAPQGADSSAEKTARYAATTSRAVSWHSGSDSDSHLQLLPDSYTAFHCKGYNSATIGHEISKRDTSWHDEDLGWTARALRQAADCLRPRVRNIPLRRASRAELDRAIASGGPPVGFVAHSDLDPSRRSDPGADFPWAAFLTLLGTPPPVPDAPSEERDVRLPPTLRMGDRGKPVKKLQNLLRTNGHKVDDDGAFGPATRAALVRHQDAHGMPADGVCGPAVWVNLFEK